MSVFPSTLAEMNWKLSSPRPTPRNEICLNKQLNNRKVSIKLRVNPGFHSCSQSHAHYLMLIISCKIQNEICNMQYAKIYFIHISLLGLGEDHRDVPGKGQG